MSLNKSIRITSKLDIESESLHTKTVNHSTSKTKEVKKQEPHKSSYSTTITSNPVKYESKGTGEPKVTEGQAAEVNPATIGYDTSQL